jgi:hypothetical protein
MRRRDFPLLIAGAGLSCTRPIKSVHAGENPLAQESSLYSLGSIAIEAPRYRG